MSAPYSADPFSIAGRRTVVVGGTAGIGLAVAEHFVASGAEVVIAGRRATGGEIAASFGARFVQLDVLDDASVEAGLGAAAELLGGGIDVLILNAGGAGPLGPIRELDLDAYRRMFDLNFGSVLRGLRYGTPYLPRGGVVLVTSSPGAVQPLGLPGSSAYGAAKSAADFLLQSVAFELAADGIRVTGVRPGFIRTEISGGDAPDSFFAKLTASGTAQDAATLAPVYHFLASDAATMLQGSIVAADDGCTAGLSPSVMAALIGAH